MDFYTIPEDVKMSWAMLRQSLEEAARDYGGHEMTFSIIVRQGIPNELVQPTYRRRETRGGETGEARPWWSVIRRMQSVGNTAGVILLEMRIMLDLQSNPVSWLEPDVRRVEPNGRRM
jgi:hypothetical protein